jgi:activator of 2-hydroxyglutaryl-CoA dehydratase
MHTKQYIRQMEKRQRIGRHTLVIGIDIGSEFNAVCLMDKEGEAFGQYPKIFNSRKGFDYFHTIVEKAKRKRGFTDVLIGMEPTGHYWRKIAFFSKEMGYEVRLSAPPPSGISGSWTKAPRQRATFVMPSQ